MLLVAGGAGFAQEPAKAAAAAPQDQSLERYAGQDASGFLSDPKLRRGIQRLLGRRTDSFTGVHRAQATVRTLDELLGIPGKVEKIGGGYLFAFGCRRHSCDEKAFVASSADGAKVFVGILDFFDRGRYTAEGRDFVVTGILHVFAGVKTLEGLPKPVSERIERWKKETVGLRRGKYGEDIKEVRINR